MSRRDSDSVDTRNETPVDLVAVQRDDALLDLLNPGDFAAWLARTRHITPYVATGPRQDEALRKEHRYVVELCDVLRAWRDDVDAEPVGDLLDTDTALAAIDAGTPRRRRRRPALGAVAAGTAVLVIAFSGVGLVANMAHPGDPLWTLTKVLHSDYTDSVEASQEAVRTLNGDAAAALDRGDLAAARRAHARVGELLPRIAPEQGHDQIARAHDQLGRAIGTLERRR